MDFRVAVGWRNHPKRRKLHKRLGADAVLALLDLWEFCRESRPDGSLAGMTGEDIALAAGYDGDGDRFVDTLVEIGLVDATADGLQIHDWATHNPYSASFTKRSEAGRAAARARWDKRECGSHATALRIAPIGNAPYPYPDPDPYPQPEPVSQDAEPSCASELSTLEQRYPAELVADCRQACASARRSGRMADTVWQATLKRLAALDTQAVIQSMRAFVDEHADGDKDERYLLGIARRVHKTGQAPRQPRLPRAASESVSRPVYHAKAQTRSQADLDAMAAESIRLDKIARGET